MRFTALEFVYLDDAASNRMNIRVVNRNMFYGANSETFAAAHQLRRNLTLAEVILWQKLKDKNLFSVKFRRQHPINIFIVDFYNHEFKIVIEIDGEIHDEKRRIEYDISRASELERYGLRILRFKNDEVIFHIDSVIQEIQTKITELGPL